MTALPVLDSGPGCNNRCSTCPRPVPGEGDNAAAFSALPLDEGGVLPGRAGEPLVLHGGEPTLHPGFEALLARARSEGRAVHVETNARAFAVGDRAQRAARAGLSVAIVTLHGSREGSHDFLTRTPGSFRQTVAGVTRLRAAGVKIVVRCVVSRSVLRELAQMAMTALGLGAVEVRFAWARMDVPPTGPTPFVRGGTFVKGTRDESLRVHDTPMGDTENFDRAREWLVPRYGLASEWLAPAVAAVVRGKRSVAVEGMPACLAPTGARVARASASCSTPWPSLDVYPAPCEGCTLREKCPGVPKGYVARFGDRELVPQGGAATAA